MQLSPIAWALCPLKKYADFSERAPRAEYWWYVLFVTLIGAAVAALDYAYFEPVAGIYRPLTILFTLGFLIPGLAVVVRRLHDSGRTGWWCALKIGSYTWLYRGASPELMTRYQGLPPLVRILFAVVAIGCGTTLLVFMIARGTEGPNRYGPDPLGASELEEVFA
jgi:uncharacterized membrane protein YhaH (DUF805 family)